MGSTNVNIGFGEARNSSRVLKPPGGGHSDIFGVHEDKTPIKRAPLILTNNIIEQEKPKVEEEKKHEPTEQKEYCNNILSEAPKPVPTPTRTRVPPGGYSSGLW